MAEKELRFCRAMECPSPDAFLAQISPIGPTLSQHHTADTWIFRGEGSDTYKPLVPSALRTGERDRLARLAGLEYDLKYRRLPEINQISGEFFLLQRFYEAADKAGLPIPEDRQELRKYLREKGASAKIHEEFREIYMNWLPNELLSLTALAQHYGLPTRMLDWSYDCHTAAYFAARDAIQRQRRRRKPRRAEHLIVWATNKSKFDSLHERYCEVHACPLLFITAPYAGNPNLFAQQGLFTLWRQGSTDRQLVDRSSLHIRVANYEGYADELDSNDVLFYRFTLPSTKAADLLLCLRRLGVSAGKLFPGWSGAAESVKELALGP